MRKLCWCSCIDCNRMAFKIRAHQMRLFAMEFSCLICALCQLQMGLIIANKRTHSIRNINMALIRFYANGSLPPVCDSSRSLANTFDGELISRMAPSSYHRKPRTRFSTIYEQCTHQCHHFPAYASNHVCIQLRSNVSDLTDFPYARGSNLIVLLLITWQRKQLDAMI